jgi:uncharacterized protein (TIGR02594 family)
MRESIRRLFTKGQLPPKNAEDTELLARLRQRALADTSPDAKSLKEYADYLLRAREIDLKTAEARKWINPIFVTVAAGLLTIAGNAILQSFNSAEQRESDAIKHQQSLFVEAFKAPTQEAALRNLEFLLDTGVLDKKRYQSLQAHIDKARAEGTGPIISTSATQRIAECRVPAFAEQYEKVAKAAGSWGWMERALNEYCVNENGPDAHRQRIAEYLQSAGWTGDPALINSVPWSAAFVVWALKQAKPQMPVPTTANAAALLKFGEELPDPKFGCLVFMRRSEGLYTVGFYIADDSGGVQVLGGNFLNSVRISRFAKSNIVAYRMPK